MNCFICAKILRSDNKYGACRKHKHLSSLCREKAKEYTLKYRNKRIQKWKNRSEDQKKLDREKNNIATKKWRNANIEKKKIINKNWVKNNPNKVKIMAKKCRDKIRKTPNGNLNHRMEVGMRQSLKQNKAGRKWEELVDYTVDDLKKHIESLFKDDMDWNSFLMGKIHIDHILPKSHFNYNTPEDDEFQKCWALSNLQPLWARDNQTKSDKIEHTKALGFAQTEEELYKLCHYSNIRPFLITEHRKKNIEDTKEIILRKANKLA